MEKINSHSLEKYTNLLSDELFECNSFGMSNATIPNTIAFIDDEKYINEINNNPNITVVICNHDLKNKFSNKVKIFCDDPRYYYYYYFNKITESNYIKLPNKISEKAIIHPRAFISDFNVVIGDGTYIGPNVTILEDVEIGSNCYITAGVVIGSEGYEFKKTTRGIIHVKHNGKVIIGNNVRVGANSTINKGFSFRNTIIEDDVKIDDLVYIAHAVNIGKGCLIVGSTMISGSTTLKDNVWLGPGTTITSGITLEENAYVTLGSVVTKSVNKNEKVTGNFAIAHNKFIENLKKK